MKVLAAAVFLAATTGFAQSQPAASRNQVAGTIANVDTAAKQLVVKSDKGDSVTVAATDRTLVLRIPPGETDPKKGAKIALTDLAVGDRVVAVSKQPADGKSVDASAILVMTKSDVAQIQQKEQEDWRRRGMTGTVTAMDPAARTVTFRAGMRTVTLKAADNTMFHRYSPDSARFADAKPSSLGEIKVGDQLRVLGNRNEDGTEVSAEKVVFGTFRQIAATIKSIDPSSGELTVTDLATKKPLTIRISPDSTMRKLPEMQARMLARRYAPGAQQAGAPAAAAPVPGRGAAGGPPRGGGDVGQMLDSLPPMPISELKPGDAIMVSTTTGSDPSRVTALTLLAGVEPLLTASPNSTRDIMSGWNLGGGAGEGQ
jgi:hypothetical protein